MKRLIDNIRNYPTGESTFAYPYPSVSLSIQQSPIALANNIPLDRFEEASKLLHDFLQSSSKAEEEPQG